MRRPRSELIEITVPPKAILQSRRSEKWRAYDPEILPMPFAVMDYELAAPIKETLIDLIQGSDTGYLGKIPELGASLSHFSALRWNWKIDPHEVKIATDVGVGVIELARQLLQPGDQILINTPVYYNFNNWIKEIGCIAIDAPLRQEGLEYFLDFDAIEKSYSSGVKFHILCNPHNPVGTVFSQEDLAHLADLAYRYNVTIAADEIHAPLVYQEKAFTPFLAASESAKEVGVAFLSATKAWNIAGLKCAQIVAQSERSKALVEKLPIALHSRASLFGAVASATAYSQGVEWLDAVIRELDRSRHYLKELLDDLKKRTGFEIGYRKPEGSYFGWLDLRAISFKAGPIDTLNLAEIFLEAGKIAIAPGIAYGPSAASFIRMNFATSRDLIKDAIDRIEASLETVATK